MTTNATTAVHHGSPSLLRKLFKQGVIRGALSMTVITLAGFGFLYSLAGVGIGQAFFPHTANGSLIERQGKIIGSELVAQPFVSDQYFYPRPSASDYNPMSLAGSNQARTNPDLRKRLIDTRMAIAQRESVDPALVPGDLFTQSGSGIDPHISLESAAIQVDRIARTRHVPRDVIDDLLARHTEQKQWGFFGAPRINVLTLNLALDAINTH